MVPETDGVPAVAGGDDPPAPATGGMVAASHHAVSDVGAKVLASGGNAVDATLAMAAMCWIALPGQCGIGGDAFAVIREPDGSVWTVGGSGYGPDGSVPGFYAERRLTALPLEGPLAVAVPGAVAAMAELHGGATRGMADLWQDAIGAAEHGLPCSAKTRADVVEHRLALGADPDARDMFLPGGRVPAVGQRLQWPRLAATMRSLAADPALLYRGEFAERAVAALCRGGAPFSGEEWELGGTATVAPAITGRYRNLTVHHTAPPTPGWMVLQQAALCDGELADLPWLSASSVHHLAAAARRAFADRWQRCGSDTQAWRELLEPAAVDAARREIRAGDPVVAAGVHPDGDTTSTVAVDDAGRAVSFIHSLAFTFGARTSVPGTGIVLNNRLGRGAYLVPGHPNEVRPRRRPLHTLNAWVATDERNRLRHVGNTPGGDGQVQWNMQLLSHVADHGLDPQRAVSAPRFTVFPGSDADTVNAPTELRCESRLGTGTLSALTERGESVRDVGPWGAGGSALVISVAHERGQLVGGADPRQEGMVRGV